MAVLLVVVGSRRRVMAEQVATWKPKRSADVNINNLDHHLSTHLKYDNQAATARHRFLFIVWASSCP